MCAYSVYRNTNDTFLSAKDTVNNASPVNLLTIHVKDSNATLYLCQYTDGQPITYFKPGTSDSQVYTPAPFKIGQTKSNIEGQVDNLTLDISGIGKIPGQQVSISDLLHAYDGLRKAEVNVMKVFKGGLSDSNSYMRDTYYIDSCNLSQNAAQFTLVSKMEVQGVKVPLRVFRRDQCQWGAGSVECGANISKCKKTLASCDGYNNTPRFGGFPSIPTRRAVR
jgi:phage-related protein